MSVSVSVIIPCFNEQESIGNVLRDLEAQMEELGCPHETIVVDDGSTDGSRAAIEESGVSTKVIHHRSNRGYGASLKEGIRAAGMDYVLIMDADGQHPAENIKALLEALEDYDMVVGARKQQGSHHWRLPGKAMVKMVSEVLVGMKIPDINCGFRLIRRADALKHMHLCSDGFSFSTSITLAFLSDHMAVKFVPIDIRPRQSGKSHIRLIRDGIRFLLIIFRIGTLYSPLKLFTPISAFFFLAGMGHYANTYLNEGRFTNMSALLLVTSVLVFLIGLVSEQITNLVYLHHDRK